MEKAAASTMGASIEAIVNYANDPSDAGTFSQRTADLVRLKVAPRPTRIVNMRDLPRAPSIDDQGFALVDHPLEGDWTDRSWLEGDYVQSCLDVVKRLTGAVATIDMYRFPIVRSSQGIAGAGDTAKFLHIDQTRAEYRAQAVRRAREDGYELRRGAMFNLWKPLSPPPQDQPLAISDRRDIDPRDHVIGVNIEAGSKSRDPFVAVGLSDAPPTLYYAPDMRTDESLVFLAADFDPDKPLGCAHTAIPAPAGAAPLIPRVSVEVRILALFD